MLSGPRSIAWTEQVISRRSPKQTNGHMATADCPMAEGTNYKVVSLPIGPLPREATFTLDIGGSLAKVVYVPNSNKNECRRDIDVHMVTFDTEKLDECLEYVRHNVLGYTAPTPAPLAVRATGVGCMKFREKIAQTLHVELQSDCIEMEHAATGLSFLWRHLPPEQLLHEESDVAGLAFRCSLADSNITPCLLVNLGSALIIEQVNKDGTLHGIVGGSAQGGLTFLGLGALLTQAKSFEDLIEMAERGDRRNLDLLVKDTAGAEYNMTPSDGMVSSFGKAAKPRTHGGCFREEDVASSLLYLITDQLAQTTYLVAKGQNIHKVVFCGSFLSCNHNILQQIKTKLETCSCFLQHKVQSVFVNYENYLGAIGTFATQLEQMNHNHLPSNPGNHEESGPPAS